jgi:hypothetical protein
MQADQPCSPWFEQTADFFGLPKTPSMTVPEKAGSKGLPALEFPLKKVKVLKWISARGGCLEPGLRDGS